MVAKNKFYNPLPLLTAGVLAGVVGSGCAGQESFTWKNTPEDFVLVTGTYPKGDEYIEHFKGLEGEGLRVHSFDNPRGGTLKFWGAALRTGLAERGYALASETAVESQNRVPGIRFDFSYTAAAEPATDGPDSYYTAVLFVSDEHRVVLQMAGDLASASQARAKLPAILTEFRVRGCKGRRGPCGNAR